MKKYISQIKEDSDITFTDETKEIVKGCTDKENKGLEQISVSRETKMEELIPDEKIDYKRLEKTLSRKSKIDLTNITEEVIQEVGKKTQERIDE